MTPLLSTCNRPLTNPNFRIYTFLGGENPLLLLLFCTVVLIYLAIKSKEVTIDEDGYYDAKGSTTCRACLEKPFPKKVHNINKDNKTD